jgi:predicted O-methyltransferase YrrM
VEAAMKQIVKNVVKRIPPIKRLVQERDEANDKARALLDKLWQPPGHFYSPLPSISEVRENEESIFRTPRELPAVDLNEEEQLQLFEIFKEYYKDLPFKDEQTDGLRYYFNNPNYSYSDAICLYAMIRHAKPRRVIEIGSGYSSCVTLDTNELFSAGTIACTFIEPYPELLLSLIKDTDKEVVNIISTKLQEVSLEQFSALQENDILFIDSTHVTKVNSDVNYIFFEILPSLNSGVYIHFHDIFYPFEYPKEWIYEGRAWNEDYLLRAFLQYNSRFRIVFFNTFLEHFFAEKFIADMPLCMKNTGGSIWLRKI